MDRDEPGTRREEFSEGEIRRARAADEEAVWPLARDLATTAVLDRATFARSLQRLLHQRDAALIVATTGTEVIGYVHVLAHPAFHANGDVAWVEEVMVAPAHRGAGWGAHLMAAAEEWAVAVAGAAYLCLATRRAAPFYLALGYEESAAYFKKTLNPSG
ncbi:GNAT family N-acetyltransferase [Kineococcus sp. R8]|uniref:GNAT family N-acetyltransferase n=1 Tax=Kineococcus siccus TaxID=2696567 RepID=UPI0014131F76|nr:GNAT family N-acetyltransferase [Kineococcus siccus]NAZ82260.1 GNAT family N-acetyltransferase [Kineococcus siccus]